MTETARLVLAVDSREVDRGQRSLDGLTDKSRRAEQGTERLTRATDQLGGAYRGLRNVLAAVGIGVAIRAVVQASDTYSELRSQLRLVTESQEELNETYEAAYKLAQETRGGLGETINLYARLARSSEELDLTNQQLLTVTRAINQSFVVSGASAQEAASATLQLSQGMASGTLRGEELNSVLENSPRLARAIADGLGVTIGQLRELGAEGQLTGSAVTRALLSSADSINREFQDMPRTVGQSLQQLRNDLIDTFGETDVSGFNDAIDDLRELVTDPNFKESVVTLGTAFATLIGTMASGASEVVNFTEYLGAELASKINGVAADDIPRLERELAGLEKQLDASFLEKDIGLVFTSDEEIKRKIEEVRERLQVAYDLQQSFNQGFGNTNPDQDSGDPPEPLGGGGNDKATDSIQKRVAALQLEAETLGMTARQEELYRARKEGATAAQLAAIEGSYRQIEAYEAEQKALEFSIQSRRDAAEILAEMDKERATDIEAGEQLLERYMTEEELLQEHHERRLDVLEAARAADFDNKEKWDRAIEAENQRHEDAVSDVSKKEQFARNQLASNMLSQMSSLMSSKYKEFFLIGKAAALANVAVMAPEKAEAAAAWGMKLGGPPLAAAFTAASYIVSAAHAAQIASANFGGGGGVSGSGGYGGGVNSVPAAPAPVQLNPGAESGGSGGSLTIVFQGDVTGFDQDELADTLMNKMGDEINNLDRVVIDPKSRNGRLLRGR
ncbi:tape measure protein [Alloalcanivorax venustensis]|jgi:tape measure domain-containing protein|uniref:tape measure protein n=1 Tax=Alloalcanivorax venustensis TaxID=172371 RepID=UPI0039E5B568